MMMGARLPFVISTLRIRLSSFMISTEPISSSYNIMNLYLLETKLSVGYDQYDSMVVASPAPESAIAFTIAAHSDPNRVFTSWPFDAKDIACKQIGTTDTINEEQIVCASFNAG
jgi:hypothetical protein